MNDEILKNPGTAQIVKTEINRVLMKHGAPITGPLKSVRGERGMWAVWPEP